LKVIFAGTPANAARTLEALIAGPHEVVAVLTRPDAEVGRKRVLTPSPVAQISEAAGIKTFKATRVDEALSAELAATGAALGVVVAYGALFKSHVLNALPLGWVNLHYSLLPDWRGAAPVQNAVLAGDVDTGVTLFQLDEGMDTGPVFGTVATTIQVGETSGRLLERLTELGITLLNQELPLIEAGIARAIPQESGVARLASKPTREGARIDWNETASAIERKVLGMNPEPMAHTVLGRETFRILDAVNLGVAPEGLLVQAASPGTLVFEAKRVMAVCANNTLLQLKTVQPAGKNPMPALDWSRGAANKFSSFDVEVA
jgi:methionyl-tRNA formyltransferase